MKKTLVALACVGYLISPFAAADTLGVYIGGGQWKLDPSGGISKGPDTIDLNTDLGLSKESQNNYYVALEHPVPGLPNIKLQRQDLSLAATNVLTRTIDYGGQTFVVNDTVTSDLDLGYQDIILYYEILDNWVSVDVGVNIKNFDGSISISSSTDSVDDSLSEYVPMLYGRAKFEIPSTNFLLDFEASVISYSGDSFSDLRAAVGYESDVGLGAELGYKRIQLNIDNLSGITSDLTFDGYYFDVNFHF